LAAGRGLFHALSDARARGVGAQVIMNYISGLSRRRQWMADGATHRTPMESFMFHVSRRGALAAAFCCLLAASPAQAQPAEAAREPIRLALIEGLSGPFANTGEAVFRNLVWAAERVNARGGVVLPGGARPLQIERFDSKGQTEEALSSLRLAVDRGIPIVAQGNSSAAASALIEAINEHNEREPHRRQLFLNYSAVDPALTNEKCSFWHFRFDAHADMRMTALMGVLREDKDLKRIYLIGQDYSFGHAVLREAR